MHGSFLIWKFMFFDLKIVKWANLIADCVENLFLCCWGQESHFYWLIYCSYSLKPHQLKFSNLFLVFFFFWNKHTRFNIQKSNCSLFKFCCTQFWIINNSPKYIHIQCTLRGSTTYLWLLLLLLFFLKIYH